MTAIGPGSIVQAVRSAIGITQPHLRLTNGALYVVRDVVLCVGDCPRGCGGGQRTLVGVTKHPRPFLWCACNFRLWPPPADEALRCEPVDQDEPVPA